MHVIVDPKSVGVRVKNSIDSELKHGLVSYYPVNDGRNPIVITKLNNGRSKSERDLGVSL